ncbi:uncharacterized protein LOC117330233 [Pecten maximus]|uniref:uncharacterized protein LOC117330233 n=1 Tax=Pecten maximus TaxID=6579 RepID=UPI00145824DA|nr:uncharacterized protein LOC117330233 [Pecten maximus]
MGLLQISLITIVACVLTVRAEINETSPCMGDQCGCVTKDETRIGDKDWIFDPLRTQEFQYFGDRIDTAVRNNWIAYLFLKSFFKPDYSNTLEVDRSICKPKIKSILGMWKDFGNTLCWILGPDIHTAECCGEPCCGPSTRCEPSLYVRRRYLVYCDYYYRDGPKPYFTDINGVGTDDFDPFRLDSITTNFASGNGDIPAFKRGPDANVTGYFVFRDDLFPLTCSCKTC